MSKFRSRNVVASKENESNSDVLIIYETDS